MNYHKEIEKYGSVRKAAIGLGIPRTNLQRLLKKEANDVFNPAGSSDSKEDTGINTGKSPGLAPATSQIEESIAKDAFTAECERLGLNPSEVTRGWIKGEKSTIQVDRKKKSLQIELSSAFVEVLDSARRCVIRGPECSNADSMLVVSLCDVHMGKLAYKQEAGENYDVGIASAVYRHAVSDTLKFFNPSRIKRIVMPIGHDLLHTDNLRGETSSGTRVDSVDTRFHRIFDVAVASVIAGIEDCLEVADVFVPAVFGNHDENCSILLVKVLKQYFRNDPRVTVDDTEIGRKYMHWGCNLLCMTHRFTKLDSAPNIMATEAPEAWGLTTTREILTGHLHSRKATSYRPYYETHGVVVRVLPSLSATDKWHAENGFVSNLRAAESHLYSEETGLIGSHLAKVRT